VVCGLQVFADSGSRDPAAERIGSLSDATIWAMRQFERIGSLSDAAVWGNGQFGRNGLFGCI